MPEELRRQGGRASAAATWSVVVPMIAGVLCLVTLLVSQHVGSLSTNAGLQENNNAVTIAVLICAIIAWLAGGCSMFLAIRAKRKIISSLGALAGGWMADLGLALSIVVVIAGVGAFGLAMFFYALKGLTF